MRSFLFSSFLALGFLNLVLPVSAQDFEASKAKKQITETSISTHNQAEARALNGSSTSKVLNTRESIGSAYEKAKLLCIMALQLPKANAKTNESYSQAAKAEGSIYEYEKVMTAW